jgi:hypothetical protein
VAHGCDLFAGAGGAAPVAGFRQFGLGRRHEAGYISHALGRCNDAGTLSLQDRSIFCRTGTRAWSAAPSPNARPAVDSRG